MQYSRQAVQPPLLPTSTAFSSPQKEPLAYRSPPTAASHQSTACPQGSPTLRRVESHVPWPLLGSVLDAMFPSSVHNQHVHHSSLLRCVCCMNSAFVYASIRGWTVHSGAIKTPVQVLCGHVLISFPGVSRVELPGHTVTADLSRERPGRSRPHVTFLSSKQDFSFSTSSSAPLLPTSLVTAPLGVHSGTSPWFLCPTNNVQPLVPLCRAPLWRSLSHLGLGCMPLHC